MLSRDAKNSAICEPIDTQLTNTSSRVWYYRSLYARMAAIPLRQFQNTPWTQNTLWRERHVVSPFHHNTKYTVLHGRRFTKSDLSANFRRKGASPTNHCWCQKTRLTAFSCDIIISAVHCIVWSLTNVTDEQARRF